MLKRRERVAFGDGSNGTNKPWKQLLRNNEQIFLTDNQFSIFVDKERPGCERTHFYPLPFPHKFTQGKWVWEELVNHDSLRSSGPSLDFTPQRTRLSFQPHVIKKVMESGRRRVTERCAVSGDTLIIEWDMSGMDSTQMTYSLPHFAARLEESENGAVVSIKDQVFVALSISGAAGLSFEHDDDPFRLETNIIISEGRKIYVALSYGYNKDSAVQAALRAAEDPESVFAAAEDTWDSYFGKVVPRFSCSDKKLEKLYYYQAYLTRANIYDIPYEPFTHPYTCPWKTGALWQWSWNTPMDSICERWLNDKRIGAGGILLEGTNGGALNIGTYLHPLRKVERMRDHNEHNKTIGEYLESLPAEIDMQACTTMPHTTPNGLLGAWEFYLCSGDREFLRDALAVMVEAEEKFSRHELETGLCTCTFVDEFDYSIRLKPYIKCFSKGDPEMMLKMDTPFIAVDYNSYLHALRERVIQATGVIGASGADVDKLREKNDRLKAAINAHLWDEADGFYYDADPRDMRRSGIKCIAGFAPLYAGIATSEQAARLVTHLTDPSEFGTPYPCPSISMDTPGVDPSLPTYGGDSLISSGIWFTVEGLIRYGYDELAARYIMRTIEMMTKGGPSSSYSYNSVTGECNQGRHTLASQSAILMDLICKYIIGLNPTSGCGVEIKPIALPFSGLESLSFGPYQYCDKTILIKWSTKAGYRLSITTENQQ
ncbi:MAG: MGH1-like glycoside hydrolase domain-containing protein [Armatimonadota bacterium]